MPSRFLNNIRVNDSYTLPSADGSVDQVITTDGSGNLSFIDVNSVVDTATGEVYYTVKNSTGSQLLKGKAVMAVGTDGNSGHILVDEMVADGSVDAKYFLGVLAENINNGNTGKAIHFGQIDQFDTRGQNGETWQDGQILWCDPANPGDFTITEPDGPNLKKAPVFILKSTTNGKIQVRVQTNEGVKDLYDTRIASQIDGDVLVWDNTTGVWFNDSTLNVDYTAGNVGIGTTSPARELDVTGTGNVYIRVTAPTSTDSSALELVNTAEKWTIRNQDTNDNALEFSSDGGTKVTMERTGNVGIGTISPAKKLTIGGIGIGNTDGLKIEDPGNTAYGAHFSFDDNSTTVEIGGVTNNTLNDCISIAREATRTITIDTSERVGIGVTTPSQKLEVNGNIQATGTRSISALFDANHYMLLEANSSGGVLKGADGGVVTTLVRTYGDSYFNGGNVGIGTTSPSEKLHIRSTASSSSSMLYLENAAWAVNMTTGIAFKNGANYTGPTAKIYTIMNGAGNQGGEIRFATLEYSATNPNPNTTLIDRMTIDDKGEVGIGTTSPNEKLEVAGNTRMSGSLDVGYANNGVNFIQVGNQRTTDGYAYIDLVGDSTYSDYGLRIIRNNGGANTSSEIIHRGTGIFNFNATQAAPITFRTSNLERLRIDSSGNVGIGATSSGAKLEVEQSNSGTNTVFLSNSYNNKGFRTGNAGYATFSGYQDGNNTSSGNAYGALIGLNTFYNGTSFYNDNQYVDPSSVLFKDGNILFHTNDISAIGNFTPSERLRITKTGNVGIGTNSPTPLGTNITTLDIQGSSGGGFRFGTTGGIEAGIYNTSSGTYIGSISNVPLYLRANNSTKATILANGDVGIGITSPGEKLEVNGTIKATASTDAYKGYIKQTVLSHAAEKIESTSYYFLPYNATSTSPSAQYYNRMTAAYGGRIKKIYLRHAGGSTPTATAVNFKKHTNGVTSPTVYSATVANTASTNMTAYYDFADSDFTFNAGDLIGLLYQTTDAFGTASKTMGGIAATIIIEYNIT